MAGSRPLASAAASREPAVVRARKDASWARVKGSEEEEDGAGAEVDEGAQEVDEKREETAAAADAQASPPTPYKPPAPPVPPRPRERAEGRKCVARLREAKRCWAGAGVEDEEGLDDAAVAERRALADAGDGDGEAPRGSGEPVDAAATLVGFGDRTGSLPRGRGARAGAAPPAACAEEAVAAEGVAAVPRRAPAAI